MTAELLSRYAEALEGWCDEQLQGYVERFERGTARAPTHEKEFNDPVWGTVSLDPLEIVVLDSPLLQRLRRVRQLGVAHYLYPSAVHTRLEHSLGVVQQVTRLIESFNLHAQGEAIDEPTLRMLRLAALCHDVGHGVMSHVSENALSTFYAYENLINAFEVEAGVEHIALGELNSSLIIASPAFGQLLDVAQDVVSSHVDYPNLQSTLSNVVIGTSISERIPFLHEVISGPFDADKLDYLTRDSYMCGVPIITDVNRLVQKARAANTARDRIPAEILEGLSLRDGYTVTGIAQSGNRTLDELTLARTLLFDKVYRHHKVRGAEALVTGMFRQIQDAMSDEELLITALKLTDDAILTLPPAALLAAVGKDADDLDTRELAVLGDISRRLRERDLLVRVAAFSPQMPADPYASEPSQKRGLGQLAKLASDGPARRDIEDKIVESARQVLIKLGRDDELAAYPGETLSDYIYVDPPRAPTSVPTAKALLLTPGGDVLRYAEDTPETPDWAKAYNVTRDVGYVFGPSELSPLIYLAAEEVFLNDYDVRLPEPMLAFAKQDRNELKTLRKELSETGHYEGRPHRLRPLPTRLEEGDIPERLTSIQRRLAGYQGPSLEIRAPEAMRSINEQRIIDWLRQFEEDGLVDAALKCLIQMRLIGRQEISDAVEMFVENHPHFENADLVVLGSAKDSSAAATYQALDAADDLRVRESLASATQSGRPILLVDDFIFSGTQARSVVSAWFGDLELALELGEDREDMVLAEDVQSLLQERQVGFVFAAGRQAGKEELLGELDDRGLESEVMVGITDIPRAFEGDVQYRSEQELSEFRARCEQIGLALLEDRDDADEKALGYGNEALLLTFASNTPTQTLTCIWKSGVVDGVPWTPLLPRRPKT